MIALIIFISILALIFLLFGQEILIFFKRKAARYKKVNPEVIGSLWKIPLYKNLPDKMRNEVNTKVYIFLQEKTFLGPGSDDFDRRVRIAFKACLPLICRKTNYYGRIDRIYINEGSDRPTHANDQEINWFSYLYENFKREINHSTSLSEKEFITYSQKFFFEPEDIKDKNLFSKLSEFYNVDPLLWN